MPIQNMIILLFQVKTSMISKTHANFVLLGISVFLCCSVAAQNNSCFSDCKQLAHYDCTICYESCPSAEGNISLSNSNISIEYTFQMNSCKQTYCSSWQTDTYYSTTDNLTHTQTYCAEYSQRNLNEQDCIKSCCNNPHYFLFTNATFNQCVIDNEILKERMSQMLLILIIVVCVAVAIIIIVVICKRCQVCLKIKSLCCFPCFKEIGQLQQINREASYIQNNRGQNAVNINSCESITEIFIIPRQKLTWIQTENNMKQNTSECCAVCLDANINCQTACGHNFHLLCFKSWIRKNPLCPLCITTQYNKVRIFCQNCHMRETSENIFSNSKQKQSFFIGNKIFCDRCKDPTNYKDSACIRIVENEN